jgi:predicted DNA-binding transcriptional regulator AlpA
MNQPSERLSLVSSANGDHAREPRSLPSYASRPAVPEPGRTGQSEPAGIQPLLLDVKQAAAMCGVSPATWWRWDAAGRIPSALKLSAGVKRWRADLLRLWVERNCPDRASFEEMLTKPAVEAPQ